MNIENVMPLMVSLLSGGLIGGILTFISSRRRDDSDNMRWKQDYVQNITQKLQENLLAEISRIQAELEKEIKKGIERDGKITELLETIEKQHFIIEDLKIAMEY